MFDSAMTPGGGSGVDATVRRLLAAYDTYPAEIARSRTLTTVGAHVIPVCRSGNSVSDDSRSRAIFSPDRGSWKCAPSCAPIDSQPGAHDGVVPRSIAFRDSG